MVLPRCNFTLRRAIGVAILFVVLLTERTTAESANISSPISTTQASSNMPTSPTESTSRSITSENYPEVTLSNENFTSVCRNSLTSYVYTAIVAHNMNLKEAKALHFKNKNFKEVTRNLTNTIMSFADQVGKLMYMYNVCTEPPIDIVAQSKEMPEEKTSSDTTTLLLLFVILVLSSYIGYLTYQIRTRYSRNSSILIDER